MLSPRATAGIRGVCVVLVLLGSAVRPMRAQESTLRFERPPVTLTQPIVTSLLQDRYGFVWIGTQGGLVRYDGHTPRVYSGRASGALRLPSSAIRHVIEHSDGRLWVATLGGLAVLSADRDSVRVLRSESHPEVFPLTDALARMVELPDGRVAAGSAGGGLIIFGRDATTAWAHLNDPDDPTSLPSNTVEDLAVDATGALWVGTAGGLARLPPTSDRFERIALPPASTGFDQDEPRRLSFDPSGILWVGGLDAVLRIDPESRDIRRFQMGPTRIQSLLAADADSIWVGTYGDGLYLLDGEGRVVQSNHATPGVPQTLRDNRVSALLRDGTGLLWLGMWGGGVQTADPRGAAFRRISFGSQPLGQEVTDIDVHASGQGAVVTTYEGGVHVVAPDGRVLRHIPVGRPSVTGEPSEALTTSWSAEGPLLVGTMRLGVQEVRADGSLRTYEPTPGDTLSLPTAAVYAIARDAAGRIWVGTGLGLRRFDLATGTFHRPDVDDPLDMLRNTFVRSIRVADDGMLFVATLGEGLFIVDPDGGRVVRLHSGNQPTIPDDEIAVAAVNGRYAWFGTRSGGTLHRVSGWGVGDTLRVDLVGPSDGVGGSVQCLTLDGNGRVWASTPSQIIKIDPTTLALTVFGAADGLPAGEYRTASCGPDGDGHVWFGQQTGATVFHPDSVDQPRSGTTTTVSSATFGDVERIAPFGAAPTPVAFRTGLVSFHLAVMDFRSPEHQTFSYRLNDGPWTSLGEEASVTFANLLPGTYTFQARGRDAHGFLAEPTTPVAFEVLPPFYRTTWFRTLLALTVAGIVVGLFQWRTRTIRKHNAALRDEIAERERLEAQRSVLEEQLRQAQKLEAVGRLTGGIAHDFNNILTVLMGNAELLLESTDDPESRALLAEIHRSGGVASRLVSQLMVFSRRHPLTPTRIDMSALVHRMAPLLRRSLGDQVEVTVDPTDEPAPVVLDANQMESALLNLAINARDAMPTGGRLTLSTRRADLTAPTDDGVPAGRWVVLRVTDTGTGISPDVIDRIFEPFFTTKGVGQGSGLGLSMVYGFVEESEGHVRVHSEQGRGTEFSLYLPAADGA